MASNKSMDKTESHLTNDNVEEVNFSLFNNQQSTHSGNLLLYISNTLSY
jgi:hypothetical protein